MHCERIHDRYEYDYPTIKYQVYMKCFNPKKKSMYEVLVLLDSFVKLKVFFFHNLFFWQISNLEISSNVYCSVE